MPQIMKSIIYYIALLSKIKSFKISMLFNYSGHLGCVFNAAIEYDVSTDYNMFML